MLDPKIQQRLKEAAPIECSPYLLRPLRSEEQARREIAAKRKEQEAK